jgi:hypothetical protein
MEWTKFDWFVFGLFIGGVWLSAWKIAKTVWIEFKKARDEWSKSR